VFRKLDEWIRHRLRAVQLKQWRNWHTVFRELRARGVPERSAAAAATHSRCWWRTANHPALKMALPNRYYSMLGIPSLHACPQPLELPDVDPHVRWCGRGTAGLPAPLSRFPMAQPSEVH
jgi:hypothetical protein